ncbi:MAG: SpoIIE family protein phosphatase [Phycisphaerae bacterium]|nr:SpoIIE family protein phosphatase [Phycisphaerae bacterium]
MKHHARPVQPVRERPAGRERPLRSHNDRMSVPNDKALQDLQKVLDISRAMVATHELDDLLPLIIHHSLELLEAERATLFLHDEARNELVARIATGVRELRVPADKGFCGETVRTGKTLVVPDAYADSRFNPQVDKDTGFHTRNIMSVPLRGYEGKLVGVLQVLNKRTGDFAPYDVELAETLGAQAGVVIQRARLIEHYVQKQKMERAMQIARDIQRGLLPEAAPEIPGFDAAGLSEPADETGGDTFDFIPLPNGRWAFVVADATGHGIGPALVIAETRAMLRASAQLTRAESTSVAEILRTANQLLARDLGGGTFVTCFLGVLDPAAGVLTYASAGHGPLLFYHRAEDAFEQVAATSLPLGVMEEAEFDEVRQFKFAPGDWVVVTTDGVFEAMDARKNMFGVERMLDAIRSRRDGSAKDLIAELQSTVARFAAGLPQADDLTAIALKKI